MEADRWSKQTKGVIAWEKQTKMCCAQNETEGKFDDFVRYLFELREKYSFDQNEIFTYVALIIVVCSVRILNDFTYFCRNCHHKSEF